MEIKEKNENEGNDDAFKIVISIIVIIILSYLIEKNYPQYKINIIYILISIIIILVFIKKYLPQNISNKIFGFIRPFMNKINLFDSTQKKKEIEEYDKQRLEEIKYAYKLGYLSNKKNNNINLYNENLNYNLPQQKYLNKNEVKNDKFLANKISNINKINNDYLRDQTLNYFNSNNKNNNIFTNQNLNNNNDNNPKFTNLPNYSDENKDKNNYLGNKSIVANPFNSKINVPNSDESSGNYFLFSNNKKKNQNKFISSNNLNPINRFNEIDNFQSTISYFDNKVNKIPKNKEVSYYKFQNLKRRNENTHALNQNNNSFDYSINNDKIPKELLNINYNNWIIKIKIFISKNLIPNIISKHENNISNLNLILNSLGIKIISTTTENNEYLDILSEKLFLLNSDKINEVKDKSNLLYENLKNNNIDNIYFYNNNNINNRNKNIIFPSLNNNLSSFLNDTKELNNDKDNEKELSCVFFGDTNKIKMMLKLIENKINELRLNKNSEYNNNLYIQRQNIIKTINYNNNPFFKKYVTKRIDDYIKNKNDENNLSLTYLQRLLYERIIINERLYPKELFDKKSEDHALLVIEYAIERFKQLQQNFENYGNGTRGGEFLNENWCSLLPTDSQLIAHLLINYIENIYIINNNQNQQKFLISFPMNYIFPVNENSSNIKNQTSIFLYQINPRDTEPVFNVVYNNVLIPCILGDLNLFHAFCIYFYLLMIKSPNFVMNLGIHDFINNIIN